MTEFPNRHFPEGFLFSFLKGSGCLLPSPISPGTIPKQKIPSIRSHAKDPKRKVPSERYQAKGPKRKIPSERSQANRDTQLLKTQGEVIILEV